MVKAASIALVLGLALAACDDNGGTAAPTTAAGQTGPGQPAAGTTLAAVRERGTLRCGVNRVVAGFGFVTPAGEFEGFDIDFCRVVAAAVLGDATKVEFRELTAEQRFTALQSGEIDVLIRNTTWTAKRDGAEGGAFAMTTFYDGQGMMVRADSRFQRIEDMGNTTICVLSGTTTELNLESRFQVANLPYTPLPFEENTTLQEAFVARRCDGWTSDKSQLAGVRSIFPAGQGGPEGLRILDETFSKEPLGPVVRDGDQDWYDAVNWAVIVPIQAEEFGITRANVEAMKASPNPEIKRFLGVPGADAAVFESGLGLSPDFAVRVVSAVGNYEEIYNRHVGPDTPLGLERGVNSLWTDGGLLYPPPYR